MFAMCFCSISEHLRASLNLSKSDCCNWCSAHSHVYSFHYTSTIKRSMVISTDNLSLSCISCIPRTMFITIIVWSLYTHSCWMSIYLCEVHYRKLLIHFASPYFINQFKMYFAPASKEHFLVLINEVFPFKC